MINLGLSGADQIKFQSLLASNHTIYTTVNIMYTDHTGIASLSDMFLGGQINLDDSQSVNRSATLSFLDPEHKIAIDAKSPADGALYMDRMLGVQMTVIAPDRSYKYTIPLFCGPMTKVDRSWSVVTVECKGKEIMGLSQNWRPKTYHKGVKKTDVIINLLREYLGERKYSIPDWPSQVTTTLAMSSETQPWDLAKNLAATMGMQLFYDGRGVAVSRVFPTLSCWAFYEGNGGTLLTKPQVSYDLDNLINAVKVIGTLTKGTSKLPLIVERIAPSTHPLSPAALGRNQTPRYLFEVIKDENINSLDEATALANTRLAAGLVQGITLSFDTLPVFHLELGDMTRVMTSEFSLYSPLKKMTIPLTADGVSNVGYLRSTTKPNKLTIRRNIR